jgi:hypothetical protein
MVLYQVAYREVSVLLNSNPNPNPREVKSNGKKAIIQTTSAKVALPSVVYSLPVVVKVFHLCIADMKRRVKRKRQEYSNSQVRQELKSVYV